MLYVDHIEEHGVALFKEACAADLEGIIAKWGDAPYRLLNGESSWVKIKNKAYSQAIDRAFTPKVVPRCKTATPRLVGTRRGVLTAQGGAGV